MATWPGLRFSVKRCCACDEAPEGCTIDSDTFDGDLSKWTDTGSPSVAGGLLSMSAGDQLVLIAEPTLATDGVHLATNAETADATATMRLFAGRDDDDNLVFGELAIAAGAGTIRVGQRVGGVEDWLSEEVPLRDDTELTDPHALELCWNPPQDQDPVSGVTGANYPTAVDDLDFGWDSPVPPGFGTAAFGVDSVSSSLNCRAFELFIPVGATIDGIDVGISARADLDTPNCGFFHTVQLFGPFAGTATNLAASTQISDSGFDLEGFGGPTENWGVTISRDDLMDASFGVAIKVEASGTSTGGTIQLEYVHISVWYTGPDKTPGRVTLTYTNTEVGADPETQCAIGSTDYEPTGKGTGMAVSAGDWEFSDFTASYLDSPTHTPCPTCTCGSVRCSCCAFGLEASSAFIVDLGAGGWTNDECGDCSGISGEYALDFAGTFNASGNPVIPFFYCYWQYNEDLDCDRRLSISLLLWARFNVPGDCYWTLNVRVSDPTAVDPQYSTAEYGLLVAGEEHYNCDEGFPMTLPIWNQHHFDDSPPCGGTMPATVELSIP